MSEFDKVRNEILEIFRRLNDESLSLKGSDIYKLYRDYLKLSMKLSFNNPSFDMDKSRYPYGNCYSYALGLRCPNVFARMFEEKCIVFFPYNIGFMHTFFTSHDRCEFDLENDLDSLDIKHFDVDYEEPCERGGYKISLYESDDDFHFIRENSDGTWSHKFGFSSDVEMVKPSKYLFDKYEYVKTMEIVKPLVRSKK